MKIAIDHGKKGSVKGSGGVLNIRPMKMNLSLFKKLSDWGLYVRDDHVAGKNRALGMYGSVVGCMVVPSSSASQAGVVKSSSGVR
jgi:hypothetical protein